MTDIVVSGIDEGAVAAGPIVVQPSSWPEIMGIAMRQLGLIGGGIVSLIGFMSAHDLAGFFRYIREDEGYAFVGAAVTVAVAAYGYFRAWRAKQKLLAITCAAPDCVAVVKGAVPDGGAG